MGLRPAESGNHTVEVELDRAAAQANDVRQRVIARVPIDAALERTVASVAAGRWQRAAGASTDEHADAGMPRGGDDLVQVEVCSMCRCAPCDVENAAAVEPDRRPAPAELTPIPLVRLCRTARTRSARR